MEETQTYLNSILKKRVNAVSNPYGSKSRLTNRNNMINDNITRIPVTQEKIQDVPTIFKRRDSSRNSIMNRQSSFGSLTGGRDNSMQKQKQQNDSLQKRCTAERKQYLLITKRIDNKNEQGSVYLKTQQNDFQIRNSNMKEQTVTQNKILAKIQPLEQKLLVQNLIVVEQYKTQKQIPFSKNDQSSEASMKSYNTQPPFSYYPPPVPKPQKATQVKTEDKSERQRRKIFETSKTQTTGFINSQ